jgi:hypothetical protein
VSEEAKEVKRLIGQADRLNLEIKKKEKRIELKREIIAEKRSKIIYPNREHGDGSSGGMSGDKIGAGLADIMCLEEEVKLLRCEVDRLYEERARMRREVARLISLLPEGIHRDVLTYRYLDFCSIKETARALYYSIDYIKHIQQQAFEKIAEIRKDNTK